MVPTAARARTRRPGPASSTSSRAGGMSGAACEGGAPWVRRMPSQTATTRGAGGRVRQVAQLVGEPDGGQPPAHGADPGAVAGELGEVGGDGVAGRRPPAARGARTPAAAHHLAVPQRPAVTISPAARCCAARSGCCTALDEGAGPHAVRGARRRPGVRRLWRRRRHLDTRQWRSSHSGTPPPGAPPVGTAEHNRRSTWRDRSSTRRS
jgi:hypothetical protein